MALLNPQTISVIGVKPTFTAAASLGDTIKPADGQILIVTNSDSAPHSVTLVRPGTEYGQANPDVTRAVPAGETHYLFVPPEFADPSNGLINVLYTAVTAVTVALVRI